MRGARPSKSKPCSGRVLESLKARARQDPLPIENGKIVTAISFERNDFDRSAALDMLRARGATDEDIRSLYRASMVEQIREVNDPSAGRSVKSRKRAKPTTTGVAALIDAAFDRECDIILSRREQS